MTITLQVVVCGWCVVFHFCSQLEYYAPSSICWTKVTQLVW